MTTPARILFLTCMPLSQPKSASMAFMNVLLERYPDSFAWFSLRANPNPYNLRGIPHAASPRLQQPARFSTLRLLRNYLLHTRTQARRAAAFGRQNGCEMVLADLAFEAVIAGRLAAKKMGVPLLVNVHDDPVSRLRVKGIPGWFLRWYEKQFAKTLRAASRVGVISDYMGEVYQQRYGVHTTTLYIGVEEEKCLPPRCPNPTKQPIVIASLGSLNSVENWELLIAAVRQHNQQPGAQPWQVLHIGKLRSDLPIAPEVEVTGWLPEEAFLQQLDRADICFVNWSFAPKLAEAGRLSFPLKIHSFIQAQRPMLALGPADSSVCRFVRENACGAVCTQPDAARLAQTIEFLITDKEVCTRALVSAAELMQRFSRETFFAVFNSFTQVPHALA